MAEKVRSGPITARFLNWFIRPKAPTLLALVALAAGLAAGIAISASRSPLLHTFAAAIEPLGVLWVNAIRFNTFINVTGDMAVAAILAPSAPESI